MNILIGCERSGALRSRFATLGHTVWSCDLEPAEPDSGGGCHAVFDVFHVLVHPAQFCGADKWDLFICHPPCTALCVSGNAHYAAGKPKYDERLEAMRWTASLWSAAERYASRACFENPRGVLSRTYIGKPSQSVQPYQFGDDASKTTDLWLRGLPPLVADAAKRVPGRLVDGVERWSNQTDSGQNRLAPSPSRAFERARTYPGIADAMVSQWGAVCP